MRTDILYDTVLQDDVQFYDTNHQEPVYATDFQTIDGKGTLRILLDERVDAKTLIERGILIQINYKEFVKLTQDVTQLQIALRAIDGYEVDATLYISQAKLTNFSNGGESIFTLNYNGLLRLKYDEAGKDYKLYNGEFLDFDTGEANSQNKDMLLACVAGNFHRYPTSGVGLVRYVHSNIESSNLAQKLNTEFENDNMLINSANYISATGQLQLDINYPSL